MDPCPGDRPFLCVDHSCVASPFHCRTYEALDDADGDGIDAAVDPAETQPGSTVVADGLALLVQSPPATRGLFFRWPRTQQGVGVEWELVSDDPTTPVALSARGWDAANGAPLPLFAGVADDYVEVVASAGAHASFASGSLVVLVHRGPLMLRLGSRVEISISDGSRVVVEEVGAGTQSVLHAADGEGQVIVAVDRAQTALAPGESIVVAGESVPVPGLGALGRVALALLLAAVVALPTRARRVRSG